MTPAKYVSVVPAWLRRIQVYPDFEASDTSGSKENANLFTTSENVLQAWLDRVKERRSGCIKQVIGRTWESDLWLTFPSVTAAAECAGVWPSSISKRCRGLQHDILVESALLSGETWRQIVFVGRPAQHTS